MKSTIAGAATGIFCRWLSDMKKNRLGSTGFWVVLWLNLMLVLPVSTQASELKPVRFMLQWSHQAQFAGYYVALDKGFYRDKGLDVTIIPGGPGLDASAHLLRGDVDFA